MLPLLTQYLFQYKTVSIPHVGTIRLIQHPAQADIADKKILPPSFSAELKNNEEVSEHQLNFLDGFLNRGRDAVLKELHFLGDKLQETMEGPGFEWKGVGNISHSTETLPLLLPALEPVMAEKVWRAGAQHTIMVGDQEMTSGQMAQQRKGGEPIGKKRSVLVLAGWILLFLSMIAIALFLYTGKFKVSAAGSKLKPVSDYHTLRPCTTC